MNRARIFLLSPANCSGVRGRLVRSERARFDLAARLRGPEGAPLGEVFSFVSGLYFRGKLAYARAFARPPEPATPADGGVHIITPSAGLRTPDTFVTVAALDAFAAIDVSADNPLYREPLVHAARHLDAEVGPECDVVLLGSIASSKYVEVLRDIFGDRLLFPADFVGRGDMSRGGLLLRSVAAREELPYIRVSGATRRGTRPPKLPPRTSTACPDWR